MIESVPVAIGKTKRREIVWTRLLRTFDGDPQVAGRRRRHLEPHGRRRRPGPDRGHVAALDLPGGLSAGPFSPALRGVPAWLEGAALAVASIALLAVLVAGSRRGVGRCSLFLFAAAVVFLALADQHRLQPWTYQLLLLALILAVLPPAAAIAWSRLLVVSIYFYSALSKCDWTFLESGGGQIVDGLLTFLHFQRDQAVTSNRVLAASFAFGELLVALGLIWKRSRRGARSRRSSCTRCC